ncbi:tetraacyldisaccharide 4'-kinase [Paludibacterium purpuratum]|uniref:Tetraacyldisaccharide 4'-kinase n=1 Tax=Paludibacterium purpuratum TaxID=1144873 RepID=A0A4V3DVQ4_9NEIS|nr:tetraacyldisaccharide 4'-kinase [Paludibacterium purpuratum]TDR81589.1 lipid-A-disaccharide kinase [Paludibacterium purpuratum]
MTWLERHWYRPCVGLTWLLAPLEALFALLAMLRRAGFRAGWFKRERLPVPVVVIGNINVGGVGKTPLTVALLQALRARGIQVGVISRGYGGRHETPTAVLPDSDPRDVGDEPLLLAAAGAPVFVGRDRVAAGRALLAAHPQVQLILTDDGLQHYRLARDLEVVVIDAVRGFGSARLLPNGPLREPLSRLRRVDAVVVNGVSDRALPIPATVARFAMTLRPGEVYALADPARRRHPGDFAGLSVAALAGIGNPQRFFTTLRELGIVAERELAFPDHHAFSQTDMPDDVDAIVMTSKDAVKMRHVNHDKLWVLPVEAQIAPDLADWILKASNGR